MIAKGVSSKAVVMWEIAVGGWKTAVGVSPMSVGVMAIAMRCGR